MKIKEVRKELERIEVEYGGEIEVDIQIAPNDENTIGGMITSHEQFFIVVEDYEGKKVVNMRIFPY